MTFWGYNSRAEAEKYWDEFDDTQVARTPITVSTRGKQCTGSLDGKTYHYADGSKDSGQAADDCTVVIEGNKISWLELGVTDAVSN